MALLSILEFPAIRAAIDISLSDGNLPDSVIKLSIYQGAAENWVLERDPNAANYAEGGSTPDAAKAAHVVNAAIYRTAALLCPVIPNITRDDFGADEGYTRQAMNYAKRADELTDLASAEIAAYLVAEPTTTQMPPFFTVGQGYRGL